MRIIVLNQYHFKNILHKWDFFIGPTLTIYILVVCFGRGELFKTRDVQNNYNLFITFTENFEKYQGP